MVRITANFSNRTDGHLCNSSSTKYISNEDFTSIKSTFPETCSLEDFTNPIVQAAFKNPENWCLKILREGGAAGNLFGQEIMPKLKEMEKNIDERSKYILMRFLKPAISENYLVINGQEHKRNTVTEYRLGFEAKRRYFPRL